MLLMTFDTFLTSCEVPFVRAMKSPTARSVVKVVPVPVTVSLVVLNDTLPVMFALLANLKTLSPCWKLRLILLRLNNSNG